MQFFRPNGRERLEQGKKLRDELGFVCTQIEGMVAEKMKRLGSKEGRGYTDAGITKVQRGKKLEPETGTEQEIRLLKKLYFDVLGDISRLNRSMNALSNGQTEGVSMRKAIELGFMAGVVGESIIAAIGTMIFTSCAILGINVGKKLAMHDSKRKLQLAIEEGNDRLEHAYDERMIPKEYDPDSIEIKLRTCRPVVLLRANGRYGPKSAPDLGA